MARSASGIQNNTNNANSRAPSPSSSYSSDSSRDEAASAITESREQAPGTSASRPGSPTGRLPEELEPEDTATCQWEDCGKVFTHLPSLIEHIHTDHIGVHKSNYTCEWTTCHRRGLPQTSRFALISHIRSHTGEKPFTCPLPECDKSFTRSDALAKHMRLQHNISPPAPGRGGSRKRKRGTEDRGSPVPSMAGSASGFSTFKVEPHTPVALDEDQQHQADYFARHPPANGRHRSRSPRAGSPSNQTPDDDEGYTSSSSDTLPAHLLPHLEPSTGLVLGRSQSMVMYLLMKAKHEYAITQHEQLCEELKVVRSELRLEKEKKEEALDTLLRNVFGAEAEKLIEPIPPPPSMMEVVEPAGEPSSASAAIPMTNGHGR